MERQPSPKRMSLLVLRAQSGDREALDRLLECCQSEIFGFLVKILGSDADAEDVLQTTLLQVAKKLRWLREPTYFRAWAYRIASRQAYRLLARSRRAKEFANTELIDRTPQHEIHESERAALIAQIPDWLETLTPNGREVLVLHYLRGFTTEQISEILGIPLGTAKSRISYALSCIRKHIERTKETST